MNITFLGAAKTVTGSNFLVEAAGKKFLVDCGMYQGKATEELENEDPFLYNPEEISVAVIVKVVNSSLKIDLITGSCEVSPYGIR